MSLFNYISRLWQSLGFGIQSKTDYDYLKEVIKEPLPYYAYSKLHDKQSQLIYRICLHAYQHKEKSSRIGGKVALIGKFTSTEKKAAELATHNQVEEPTMIKSASIYNTIIIKGNIDSHPIIAMMRGVSGSIIWDIQKKLTIIQQIPNRYPEYYKI